MGYYINLYHEQIDQDFEIINPQAVLDAFRLHETSEDSFGQVSWCSTVDEHLEDADGSVLNALNQMFVNFGFETTVKDSSIVIDGWQGGKMGHSWHDVWDALALGVDAALEVIWIMHGEDNEYFGESIKENKHEPMEVEMRLSAYYKSDTAPQFRLEI